LAGRVIPARRDSVEGGKEGEEPEGPAQWGSERWYGDGVAFENTAYGPALIDVSTYLDLGHTSDTNVSFTWAELAELPTEPAALHDTLLDAYEPTGQDEEAVLYAVRTSPARSRTPRRTLCRRGRSSRPTRRTAHWSPGAPW
jgi:hypothetical protein